MTNTETRFDNTPVRATWNVPTFEFPTSARVVIVGGGIAGASAAYHFAKAGWTDVCLLEQNKIASGTTWHAAGMVGQLRSSSAQTKVNKASVDLYSRLKEETGHDPGWLQCGGLQLATCDERMYQLQRTAAMAKVFGVEAHMISAEECAAYWPMMNSSDLLGGTYLPGDGRVLPGECAVALAKGAVAGGVKIIEGVTVERLLFNDKLLGQKRFNGVQTDRGEIRCEWIVLTSNMWMRQIGVNAGVSIPVYPCEHHYVITKPMEGVTRNAPCTRDPDFGNYFRSLDDGALKLGAFKRRSKYWNIGERVPNSFDGFSLLDPDWPDFMEPFESFMHRFEGLTRDDVVKFVNGPEAFTPDNNFIMGQPSLTEGLFVMGGWNSAGIACSGGAGKYAVEWIENGGMTIDLCAVDVQRFHPFQNKRSYLQDRVSEVLGLHYQLAFPGREKETSRGVRSSPLYDIHKKSNAFFGVTAGWERPRYYAPAGMSPDIEYSFRRQNWHDWVAAEVKACREGVGILDQSTFGKFMLEGPDAVSALQPLCGMSVDCEIGKAVYTGMLNERGTYEADLVVARLEQDKFYIVTSTSRQKSDSNWITKHMPASLLSRFADVTEQFSVLSVMGPKSGQLLGCFEAGLCDDQPHGQIQQVEIGGISVYGIRVSYVGELGWELHVRSEDAVKLYGVLRDAGERFDARLIGTQAISAMRIEKGFRAFGHELSPEETPFQAGLGFAIDWNHEFIGRSALERQRSVVPHKRLACFKLDDPNVTLWGSEPILWGDELAGYTSSACYGPTLGAGVAMGYVRNPNASRTTKNDIDNANFSIVQLGEKYSASGSLKPFV